MPNLTQSTQVAWDAAVGAVSYEVTLKDGAGNALNGPVPVPAPALVLSAQEVAGALDSASNARVEIVSVGSTGLKSLPAVILGVTVDMTPAIPGNPRIEPV